MDVSVIIPLFNGKNWIRDTLTSVISQTHPPSEIIVVDDESTDNSPDIISEEFPNVRLEENPDSGPYEARNHGARCATADKLAFLDQDDLWHEDHLKMAHRTFQEIPKCAGVFSKISKFSDSESPDYTVETFDPYIYDPWQDYPENVLGEPLGGVVNREAFESISGWYPAVEGCGDYHLWLELALVGDLALTGCTTAGYRVHSDSLSQTLRSDEVESYFERYVNASEDLLERRREQEMDVDKYANRLEGQKSLLDLIKAIRRDDSLKKERAVRQFAVATSDEPHAVIQDMWDSFSWFSRPLVKQRGISTFAAELLDFLHEWPDELHRTQEIIHNWSIHRVSSLELVRRYPLKLRHWFLLVRRALRRFRSG
jgi:glycosyltransferase involved in cell wall biosynthesis